MDDLVLGKSVPPILIDGQPYTGVVTVDQEWIDVTPISEADPNWVHVDSHGHTHRWMSGPDPLTPLRRAPGGVLVGPVLPSLVSVQEGGHWCENCLGEWQPWHWVCRLCGEKVTPRSQPTTFRQRIPGLKHLTLTVDDPLWRKDDVTVELLTDPPWTFAGRVLERSVQPGFGGDDPTGSATIGAVSVPKRP